MNENRRRYTVFAGRRQLGTGSAVEAGLLAKAERSSNERDEILIFDDRSGQCVDFELYGSEEAVAARLEPLDSPKAETPPPGVGRPKLGVVSREVTLLPRHWEWLATQPSGASAALRRLVDEARKAHVEADRIRLAQEAADRFMMSMLGDEPGYEEASRALYHRDQAGFQQRIANWPEDLRLYTERLAAPVWE